MTSRWPRLLAGVLVVASIGLGGATSAPAQLTVSPSTGFTLTGFVGTPPDPPTSKQYMVSYLGAGSYTCSASSPASWVTVSGSGTISNGQSITITVSANANFNNLAAGTTTDQLNIGCSTSGGLAAFARSLSAVVNKYNSTTALGTSQNPSVYGTLPAVTFTATITGSPGVPTGTVTFKDGASTLGTGTLNGSGVATFMTNTLPVGSHAITAVYGGNARFNGSTSSALTQNVLAQGNLVVTPPSNTTFTGLVTGPYTPASYPVTLTNNGGSSLAWSTSAGTSYFNFSPTSGTLAVGESAVVTVSLNPAAFNVFLNVQGLILFGTSSGTGGGSVLFKADLRPACQDLFANAPTQNADFYVYEADISNATAEPGEPDHAGASSPVASVWCNWTPFHTAPVIFDTSGSSFDTTLAAYTGSAVGALTQVAANNDVTPGSNTQSRIAFNAQAGTTYRIAVAGAGGARGKVLLNWSQTFDDRNIFSAVLPQARSIVTGATATAFGTLLNGGTTTATECEVDIPQTFPATFAYQTTNAANILTGTPNTAVDIPAGGAQNFVFAITPFVDLNAADVRIGFVCGNTGWANSVSGLNKLTLSASAVPTPDAIAIAATPSNDGIVNVPGPSGIGVFAAAAVNIGAAGAITANVDDGGRNLPLTYTICQSNPATGACVNPATAGGSATVNIGTNETVTLTAFVTGQGSPVAFDPANNRLFLRLKTPDGVTRGATNVAVRTQ